jgi:glutathione S-transferase
MYTLYFQPGACSMAPHIVLHEIGKPFEAKAVNLRKGQQRTPEYIAINPKSKVPVLNTGTRNLSEIIAILTYLGKSHPEAKLWPATSLDEEVSALSMMSWCAGNLHPLFGRLFFPQRFCETPGSEESVRKLAAEAVATNFAVTDKLLAGKEWAMGKYSVVDAHLFVFFRWASNLKLDLLPYANYAAHQARMLARPAVQKMLETEKEAQAQLDKAA